MSLDIYGSSIFLEALQKGLKIVGIPLSSESQGHQDDEITVWPSESLSRSRIQLRIGDAFVIGDVKFTLQLRRQAIHRQAKNISDLGSEMGLDNSISAKNRVTVPVTHLSEKEESDARDVITWVDPNLISETVSNEQTEDRGKAGVDEVVEFLSSDAIARKAILPDGMHSTNLELSQFIHDSQSSTLGIYDETVSIFGHIRRHGSNDDCTTGRSTTRTQLTNDRDDDDDDNGSLIQHVPTIESSTVSFLQDTAQVKAEEDTQDSTAMRAEDLLDRAGLQDDTTSSQVGQHCGARAEEAVKSEEHATPEIFSIADMYTARNSTIHHNTLPPLDHSKQVLGTAIHDYRQQKGNSETPPTPTLGPSKLGHDENTLVELEHVPQLDSQDYSESTITVQPRLVTEKPRVDKKVPGKISLDSSAKVPASSSSSSRARNSFGSGSGIGGTVGTDSIKVLFGSSTSVDTMPNLMKSLRSLGVRKADTVNDCDYLCVGPSPIKTTANLVIAVASGKLVVTDRWVLDSAKARELLDPFAFVVKDRSLEKRLGVSLSEAVERGRAQLKPFDGFSVFFTPVVKKDLGKALAELKGIASHGGATIESRLPGTKDDQSLSIIVSAIDDPQLAKLTEDGWRCFSKDVITMTVLRSVLDLQSDEFSVGGENAVPGPRGGRRGKKRKR